MDNEIREIFKKQVDQGFEPFLNIENKEEMIKQLGAMMRKSYKAGRRGSQEALVKAWEEAKSAEDFTKEAVRLARLWKSELE